MKADEHICAMCGAIFSNSWTEEEALAEASANGFDDEECDVVCDDCYKKTPWGNAEVNA